jgi:hypothetical protein
MVEYINKRDFCMPSKSGLHCTVLGFLLIVQYTSINARKLGSWRGPNSFILGDVPVERQGHGFAEAIGRLFIFGGASRSSGLTINFDPL